MKIVLLSLIFPLCLAYPSIGQGDTRAGAGLDRHDAEALQDYCIHANLAPARSKCTEVTGPGFVFRFQTDDEFDDSPLIDPSVICSKMLKFFKCLYETFSICGDPTARYFLKMRAYIKLPPDFRKNEACQKAIEYRARGGPQIDISANASANGNVKN
ncbi:hypothetical protein DdX_10629 [Ditylenchus destructor]|uniref:Uncharacterized protein n=1 Tax=Ditylenchus destructor TaxID=166010 RepID=A0AAD4R532_9BILA|nr:hypothetical protein DdX_10629 [Ditylenchus destructor]